MVIWWRPAANMQYFGLLALLASYLLVVVRSHGQS